MSHPADYGSGLRAPTFAEPPSPTTPQLEHGRRPSWARRRLSTGSMLSTTQQPRSTKEEFFFQARQTVGWGVGMYKKLPLWQKVLLVGFLVTANVLMVLFFVYNESILVWLHPRAVAWQERSGGWLLVWVLIFITAFPPLVGYSTMLTVAGFVYGMPNGWFIAATGNVAGSLCAFLLCRRYLRDWTERRIEHNTKFAALALVLRHDGIKLLTMVRLCPLPYSLSNGALSTFPTVSPGAFAAATALASPKLLIHIFIGSRFGAIGEGGGKMDAGAKAVNYFSIAFGAVLGFVTGYVIWTRTTARAKQLEVEEQSKLEEREAALAHPDTFADDDDDDDEDAEVLGDHAISNAAAGGSNDDIDFLEPIPPHRGDEPYKDEHSDNEEARRGQKF